MSQAIWSAVDGYFGSQLNGHDEALSAALHASAAAGLPAIAVAPNQGRMLYLVARVMNARRVLEVGTLGGYSTICLGRAVSESIAGSGGVVASVVTLELDPHHAAVARANVERAGLAEVVDVRVGKAIDLLARLHAERPQPFDLTFIDADKPSNPDYFAWALKLTRPGGAIIIDNVVRDGLVTDAATRDASVVGVRKLVDLIAHEPRVSATALQTVGSKGYDGFILAMLEP